MIEYIEKGIGLHEAITAAGHWLHHIDGDWKSSNDAAVQPIIDGYTLDKAKAEKSLAVSLHAKALRDRVTSTIAAGEMASWPIKRDEAADYALLGEAAPCPALRQEALARGIALGELVAKVRANAARFLAAETAIGGTDGKHRDAIAALATFEAVASYDFSSGWPEV